MLGTRGCRLGAAVPGDLRRCRCARSCARRWPSRARGGDPRVEIMIPLVGFAEELRRMRELVETHRRRGARGRGRGSRVPRRHDDRAAAGRRVRRRDRRARRLLLVRHQRPHPDHARALARRRRGQVPGAPTSRTASLPANPFETIDVDGVGELVRIGCERGPGAREPDLKLGICGEHGGDPASRSSTSSGSTTSPARRSACRSPGSPQRRRR